MTKCWTIEQGSYSDYRIVGVFSTEENAKRVLKIYNKTQTYDEAYIEERDLDPIIAELNAGLHGYKVKHTAKGMFVEPCSDMLICEDCRFKGGAVYYVWAENDQAAIKIAAERHAQFVAQQQGIA